jgi:hypothetical protein
MTLDILTEAFCGYLQPLQVNTGIVPRLGHGHFIPNFAQFVRQPTILYLCSGYLRRKVSILGGHSIGHYKQKSVYIHVLYYERFPRQSYTDEQHAMSLHELQSALMLTVQFSQNVLY